MGKYNEPNTRPRLKVSKAERLKMMKEGETLEEASDRLNITLVPKACGKGRPLKYTPVKFSNRVNDYFAWCNQKRLAPTVKGIYMHLKIDKMTWYDYCQRPQFKEICEYAKDTIEQWYVQGLWDTPTSNTNRQLVAKQICDWKEETVHTTKVITVEEAQAKLERFLPLLLELHKQHVLETNKPTAIEGEIING